MRPLLAWSAGSNACVTRDMTEEVHVEHPPPKLERQRLDRCVAGDARSTGALLLAGAHGFACMEASGHLGTDKWQITATELCDLLLDRATPSPGKDLSPLQTR